MSPWPSFRIEEPGLWYSTVMNWDDLQLLNTAARTRSLSAAARSLGVSQPTASRRLRRIEASLGARLFDRRPDGLTPTPAGERLLPLVADMGAAADSILRARPGLAPAATGTVRISADEVLAAVITRLLAALTAAAPGVTFEVLAAHHFANLSRREADVLIRECLPDGDSLVARRLCTMAHAVYGAPALVARLPAARGEDRYRACPWVGFAEDRLFFQAQKRWLDSRIDRPPVFRSNQMTVLCDAVRAGAGLGVLPCFLADGDPGLVRLSPPIDGLDSRMHMLIHRDVLRDPPVRAAIDALAAVFRREQHALLGVGTDAPAEISLDPRRPWRHAGARSPYARHEP